MVGPVTITAQLLVDWRQCVLLLLYIASPIGADWPEWRLSEKQIQYRIPISKPTKRSGLKVGPARPNSLNASPAKPKTCSGQTRQCIINRIFIKTRICLINLFLKWILILIIQNATSFSQSPQLLSTTGTQCSATHSWGERLASGDVRPCSRPVLFLWRYEPVRRTGKSDDWLTIFFAHIIRFTVQKFQLFWVIFCIIIFFTELWHILILWLAKMPNGGMPVFTLIATGWRYRKIFFYKKSTALDHCRSVYLPTWPSWVTL